MTTGWRREDPGAIQWGAIVLMGVGPFTMANVLWDRATREGPAATLSSLAFLTPLVAMMLLAALGLGAVRDGEDGLLPRADARAGESDSPPIEDRRQDDRRLIVDRGGS